MRWCFVALVLAGCGHAFAPHYPIAPTVPCSHGSRIIIYGAIVNPGKLACSPGMHLVDAIAAAGGFTRVARRNHVELRRGTRTYVVPVRRVIEEHWPDPQLSPDDVVWISDDSF